METPAPAQAPKKGPSKVWLPVVLIIGIAAGLFMTSFVPEPRLGPPWLHYEPFGLEQVIMLHVVLSTVSIALLVALAIIYFKMYAETGARFALGLVVVLFALLVQAFIQYPLLLGLAGPLEAYQGQYLSYADLFTITAYTIFLYLSLE